MKKNIGNADRIIRFLLAALFAFLSFGGIVTDTPGIILVILGGIFLLTSFIGTCPIYSMVGFNTCTSHKAR